MSDKVISIEDHKEKKLQDNLNRIWNKAAAFGEIERVKDYPEANVKLYNMLLENGFIDTDLNAENSDESMKRFETNISVEFINDYDKIVDTCFSEYVSLLKEQNVKINFRDVKKDLIIVIPAGDTLLFLTRPLMKKEEDSLEEDFKKL